MLSKDFIDFISQLNTFQVEYLVIGGYAVSFHGYPRYTGDIDIWINVSKENAKKVMKALNKFGAFIPDLKIDDFLRNEPMVGVYLGREPNKIDIINALEGLDFDSCYSKKIIASQGDVKINYIDYDDLIYLKLNTNRMRDKADVEELEKRKKSIE
jgi:hypothetical protein